MCVSYEMEGVEVLVHFLFDVDRLAFAQDRFELRDVLLLHGREGLEPVHALVIGEKRALLDERLELGKVH